ncbi:MAG: hypothetical protein V3S04_04520 [Candidatus Omnitrophota bacterium]
MGNFLDNNIVIIYNMMVKEPKRRWKDASWLFKMNPAPSSQRECERFDTKEKVLGEA